MGQFVFHVFNRAIESTVLFREPADYDAFLGIVREAATRCPMRILAYAVMPNHWHMIVWPEADGELSAFMKWMTETHARRWRDWRASTGRGAVYQGRFKAVPIQCDSHLLRACHYVERNPLRGRLVAAAEDWPWTSAYLLGTSGARPVLAPWPVAKPADWAEMLNVPEPRLDEIRRSFRKGIPFGNITWREGAMNRLRWVGRNGSRLNSRRPVDRQQTAPVR